MPGERERGHDRQAEQRRREPGGARRERGGPASGRGAHRGSSSTIRQPRGLPLLGPQRPAVRVGDRPRDREPEAGAAVARRARPVRPVEALEDPLGLRVRDPGALVVDGDPHRAAVRRVRAEPDAAVVGRVAHRVVEQVGHDLVHALRIAVRGQVARLHGDPQPHRPVVAQRALLQRALEQRPHRERHGRERLGARLHAREVEQLRDEPPEPLRLRQSDAQGPRVGRLDAVGEVLQQGLEGADRRAQLVGDVGDEVAALAVDVRELRGHRVERAGELAHLVARRGGHPHVVAAGGHGPGGRRHLPQGEGHPVREEAHHQQPERGRDQHPQRQVDAEPRAPAEHQHRPRDRGDDDHAELRADRRQAVERPHASAGSSA